jgi:hypothetical protein
MNGRVPSAHSVENDPQRTSAGSQSRSAAVSYPHRPVPSFRVEGQERADTASLYSEQVSDVVDLLEAFESTQNCAA